MVEDKSKIYNGTLRATGTNNTHLKFDARKVTDIYSNFKGLIKTIRRNISSRDDVHAFVTSRRKGNKAYIWVVCEDDQDEERLRDELLTIIKVCRDKVGSHKSQVYLKFMKPSDLETISMYMIPWDAEKVPIEDMGVKAE